MSQIPDGSPPVEVKARLSFTGIPEALERSTQVYKRGKLMLKN